VAKTARPADRATDCTDGSAATIASFLLRRFASPASSRKLIRDVATRDAPESTRAIRVSEESRIRAAAEVISS
jgi:hypothetical protein